MFAISLNGLAQFSYYQRYVKISSYCYETYEDLSDGLEAQKCIKQDLPLKVLGTILFLDGSILVTPEPTDVC